MVIPCLCSFSARIRGELGTRTPDPLRGQQRAACAGEIGIQFHTASQLRYSAGS